MRKLFLNYVQYKYKSPLFCRRELNKNCQLNHPKFNMLYDTLVEHLKTKTISKITFRIFNCTTVSHACKLVY